MAEDLLQATLTDDDDATGFREPWRPWSIVFATFFGGPLVAGWLFSRNAIRLGRAQQAWVPLAVFALVEVGVLAYALRAMGEGGTETGAVNREARMVIRVAGLVPATAFASLQARRFRLFEMSGGEAPSLLRDGAIACLVAAVAQVALLLSLSVALG